MRRFGIYAVLLFAGLALFGKYSLASNQDNFWMEAAQGGMAEVMMGNLALQKSQNEDVRRFAQMMVDNHTRTNEELMTLAAGKNITLPTSVNNKQKAAMDKLSGITASAFDREYMNTQVKDHEKMVKLFQKQAERGADADAKAFAAKTLPNLQSHLATARTINGNVRNMNRGGGNNRDNNMNSNSGGNSNRNMNSNGNRNSDMDMNMNSSRNSNSNRNTNSNSNRNMNSNSNRNTNSNSNRNSNSNGNVNGL